MGMEGAALDLPPAAAAPPAAVDAVPARRPRRARHGVLREPEPAPQARREPAAAGRVAGPGAAAVDPPVVAGQRGRGGLRRAAPRRALPPDQVRGPLRRA